MALNARAFHFAAFGGALQLTRGERRLAEPANKQLLIRLGAASLNYRDLLTQQDATSNRDGLLPLSDGAGAVAIGSASTSSLPGTRVRSRPRPWEPHSAAARPMGC